METTTGFSSLASFISLQMTSDARALPPGEFTRNTIAFTFSSLRAFLMALEIRSEPITVSLPSPDLISPWA